MAEEESDFMTQALTCAAMEVANAIVKVMSEAMEERRRPKTNNGYRKTAEGMGLGTGGSLLK